MSTEAKTKRTQRAAECRLWPNSELAVLSAEAEAEVCALRARLSEAEAHARVIRDEVARRSSKIQVGDVVRDDGRHLLVLWVVVRVGAARRAPYDVEAIMRRIYDRGPHSTPACKLSHKKWIGVDLRPTGERWKGKLYAGAPGEVVDV